MQLKPTLILMKRIGRWGQKRALDRKGREAACLGKHRPMHKWGPIIGVS